jgi:uncharacterized membrane protein YtjA (UPF0391 family)
VELPTPNQLIKQKPLSNKWHRFFTSFRKYKAMLRWTITFLIIAVVAAIFGFGGIAAGAASIAKILFYIFIVLFLLSLIGGGLRGRS